MIWRKRNFHQNKKWEKNLLHSCRASKSEIKKKFLLRIQSVTGELDPDDLGITLCHEHVLVDITFWQSKPNNSEIKAITEKPLTMEDLGNLKKDPFLLRQNLFRQDDELATSEVSFFKNAGGVSIVDCTTIGIGRNVAALKRISEMTGVNIIAGTGFFLELSQPPYIQNRSVDELTSLMINEIEHGVDNTGGIRCGIIGEIGVGWPPTRNEENVLKAAGRAQEISGASLYIHPPSPFGSSGRGENEWKEYPYLEHCHEVLDMLEESGADLEKVIMCHMDAANYDPDVTYLAERGCYLGFDTFGSEQYYEQIGMREPYDTERVQAVLDLIERGYSEKLLLSHDVTFRTQLRRFGGRGFDHLLTNVIPMFKKAGLKEEMIEKLVIENPKRVLAF